MIKRNKTIALVVGILGLVSILFGTAYSWFTYQREGNDQELIAGDIYLNLNEGDGEIELSNIFPETFEEARNRNDNYITFDVTGLNTSTKDIYYEIILDYGTEKTSPKSRYNDSDLRFDLVELDSNGEEVEYLLSGVSYDSLLNQRIYVDTINANTSNDVEKHYKLRMWLSDEVIISDTETNANYTTAEYPNKYATIKLIVAGDFIEKESIKQAYYLIKELSSTKSYIGNYDNLIQSEGFNTQDTVEENNNKQTVYYYNGNDAASNSNVLFAGFCWQIVRTTDNGGVKLIYNGIAENNKCETTRTISKGIIGSDGTNHTMVGAQLFGRSYDYNLETGIFTIMDSSNLPTSWSVSDNNGNGISDYQELIGTYTCLSNSSTCTTLYYVGSINISNTNEAYVAEYTIDDLTHYSQIGTSVFNANYYSPAMVGYMFNKEYDYNYGSKSGTYYGNAVWENGAYVLSNGNGGTAPDVTHHYICDTDCTKIRYYYYNTTYYVLLENGKTITDALKEMINYKTNLADSDEKINVYNSSIKGYLDNWYKKNLLTYDKYLDKNLVYCNDRSVIELGGWNPNGTSLTTYLRFRLASSNKDLKCEKVTDRFSVNNKNVAELTYPVVMLTEPERNLISTNYANTGYEYWSGSPVHFSNNDAIVRDVSSSGGNYSTDVYTSVGVRPIVLLKPSTFFESGDGTYNNPYVVGPLVDRNS